MRENSKGMSGHHSARMKNDEWLTPPHVTEAFKEFGEFDLDPCSPGDRRPWDTAKHHYGLPQDGLSEEWFGRVWLNPPYGRECVKWLDKLSEHNNGIALIFARTETKDFFEQVWSKASALLFIKGRLYFHYIDGSKAKANSGAPSVLVAYGEECAKILEKVGIEGFYVRINKCS